MSVRAIVGGKPSLAAGVDMREYDGPTLRSIRENVKVPLRRVARLAGMSHGHLSKVERGEHGRPVTPAILSAYEKATGVRLSDAKIIGFGDGSADTNGAGWRRGRLSDARRRGFNATVGSVAVGGPVGEPITRMIDSLGRFTAPEQVGGADVELVEQAAALATAQDLRHGGGLSAQLARTVLRSAVGLTRAAMTGETAARLHAAIGALAHRAGWSAFDAEAHDAARSLFTVALDAAIQAKDRDLRAHVLADIAAQHNYLGYPDDAVEITSLAEGDRRVGPSARMMMFGVAARAHAAAVNPDACRHYLGLAADNQRQAAETVVAGWRASVATTAHLHASTGHALASLARRGGSQSDRAEAIAHLGAAVELFDPATHTRAYTLCLARLAAVHLADDPGTALGYTKQVLGHAGRIRSARLIRAVGALRAAAADRDGQPAAQIVELVDQELRPADQVADADGATS
jgi:transcriptional regulator with XRE-family HTH domain